MTDNTPFNAAMAKAEAALLSKRNKANAPTAPRPVRAPKEVTPANRDMVTIDGVTVPAIEYLEEQLARLRNDTNTVLDNIEADLTSKIPTPKPLIVEIVSDTVQIGSIAGLTHFQLPSLLQVISIKDARGMRMNIMLKGEMGSGKSTAARQIADGLGLKFGYIGQTLMPHDVIGYVSQVDGKYYGTAFTDIYENGGVIVLEEMDGWSPNATLVLNPALANGYLMLPDGRLIERHEDCVIIACTNTWGSGPTAKYVGRNKLDDAFMDRFGARLDWRYDTDLERAAAGNDEVVDMVQTARANARRAGVQVNISPRSSIDIAKLVSSGFTMKEAISMNFGSTLDPDQRRIVLDGCMV